MSDIVTSREDFLWARCIVSSRPSTQFSRRPVVVWHTWRRTCVCVCVSRRIECVVVLSRRLLRRLRAFVAIQECLRDLERERERGALDMSTMRFQFGLTMLGAYSLQSQRCLVPWADLLNHGTSSEARRGLKRRKDLHTTISHSHLVCFGKTRVSKP